MSADILFKPLQLGALLLPNRIVMARGQPTVADLSLAKTLAAAGSKGKTS